MVFRETGLLVLGERNEPYFKDVVSSFQANPGAKYSLYSPEELTKKYPNLTMGPKTWGCFDPVAGVLMADKCLKHVWKSYQKLGGVLIDNHPVKEIKPFGDKVKIDMLDGSCFIGKSCVICAGPWTNQMLAPLDWQLPLSPIKIPVFYYKAQGHIPHTFIFEDGDSHIWGLPELEYKGLVKICRHTGPSIDPDHRDVVNVNPDKERLRDFISKCFPKVEPFPSIEESCIYTVSN